MSTGPRRAGLEAALTAAWRRRGPIAWALWPASRLYGAVTGLRRLAYRRGWLRSLASPVPVIVVGNRVAGGAGKTPTVLAVVRLLREQGRKPGIVSRGHGRLGSAPQIVDAHTGVDAVGDEPLLLHRRAGVPVVVGADRAEAATLLLGAHPQLDCLVADDGLQHLRWRRDIEVVVLDALGVGNGWLLPAGPLREPIDVAPRGRRLLQLYTDGVRSTAIDGALGRRRLAGVVELSAWWRGEAASLAALDALRGRRVLACAGIAHPQRFFAMLGSAGLSIEALPLPDHARFDVLPWPASATDVVVTEKDAVKLDPQRLARECGGTRVWVAPLDFEPEPAFGTALAQALAEAFADRPPHATTPAC